MRPLPFHNLLILFLVPTIVQGQELGKKDARSAFEDEAYAEAFSYYSKVSGADAPRKLRFRYGVSAVHFPSKRSKGIALLEKLAEEGMAEAGFWAGVGHQLAGRSEKALQRFHAYQSDKGDGAIGNAEVERRIGISVQQQLFRSRKVHVRSSDMRFGQGVHVARCYMSSDGKTLFYQRKGELGQARGAIMVAGLQKAGPMPRDSIPLEEPFQLAGISSDADAVILRGAQEDKSWRGDLYITKKKKDGEWTEPEAFGKTINSKAPEGSAWMAPNGRLMIFSSARKGGNGGLDLYIVKKLPTGDWAKARNLSPAINTPHDEKAPHLMPEGETLYFLSEGHRNMGGTDVFRSSFDPKKGEWSVPENPGFPVNSSAHERSFSVTRNEGTAIITRSTAQRPYRTTKRLELLYQDVHITVVKGKVLAKESGEPVKAKIRVFDPIERTVQGIYRNQSDDGSFILAIRPDKQQELIVEADGYAPEIRKVSTEMEKVEIRLKEE